MLSTTGELSQPEAANSSQDSHETRDRGNRDRGNRDSGNRDSGNRGRRFNGDAEVPGTPLTYKEVIFEALREWLEENQVGECIITCSLYNVQCTPTSYTFSWQGDQSCGC